MRTLLLAALMLTPLTATWAFNWHDLWQTRDQQAQILMQSGEFDKAQTIFEDKAWQAAAAFRAQDYKNASQLYQQLNNSADNYYNEGNALARMGQLAPAVTAYNKALALEASHKDALHNRKIVEDLMKQQDKQQQDKQQQDKQQQDKQQQDKQQQDKQQQDKQQQDKQLQDKQQQNKQQQNKQQQNKQQQDKQQQDKQQQDKQQQDKQQQDKQQQDKEKQEKNETKKQKSQSKAARERQQENEQWLRLIPDDPGGLMREKFMRDYLRRQNRWNQ